MARSHQTGRLTRHEIGPVVVGQLRQDHRRWQDAAAIGRIAGYCSDPRPIRTLRRTQLRLAERAALWNAKPENRHLPSLWEWSSIRTLSDKKKWSQPQRAMMVRAGRIHGSRWGTALLVALVIGIMIQQMVHRNQAAIAASEAESERNEIQTAVAAMSTAREILVPHAIKELDDFPREFVLPELRKQFETADEARKLPLAYALAHFDDVRAEFLVSQVEGASPDEFQNFVAALDRFSTEAVTALKTAARTAESEKNWQHKARLAMLSVWLNDPALAQEMCRLHPDPIQRTWFIEECSTWHGDLSNLAQPMADSDDSALRSGIILAVGSVPVADVSAPEKQAWRPPQGISSAVRIEFERNGRHSWPI